MLGSASLIEVAYATVMLGALVITIVNCLYALARKSEVIDSAEDALLLIIRGGAVADQLKLAGAFVCLSAIGIVAMLTPPNPNAGPVSLAAVLSGVAFIVMAALLVWLSVGVRLRPSRLRSSGEKK